ncbi:hypothetical protein SRHO_G00008330 [Serrasalmus rhombeus]
MNDKFSPWNAQRGYSHGKAYGSDTLRKCQGLDNANDVSPHCGEATTDGNYEEQSRDFSHTSWPQTSQHEGTDMRGIQSVGHASSYTSSASNAFSSDGQGIPSGIVNYPYFRVSPHPMRSNMGHITEDYGEGTAKEMRKRDHFINDSLAAASTNASNTLVQETDQKLEKNSSSNWTSVIKEALEMSNGVGLEQDVSCGTSVVYEEAQSETRGTELLKDHFDPVDYQSQNDHENCKTEEMIGAQDSSVIVLFDGMKITPIKSSQDLQQREVNSLNDGFSVNDKSSCDIMDNCLLTSTCEEKDQKTNEDSSLDSLALRGHHLKVSEGKVIQVATRILPRTRKLKREKDQGMVADTKLLENSSETLASNGEMSEEKFGQLSLMLKQPPSMIQCGESLGVKAELKNKRKMSKKKAEQVSKRMELSQEAKGLQLDSSKDLGCFERPLKMGIANGEQQSANVFRAVSSKMLLSTAVEEAHFALSTALSSKSENKDIKGRECKKKTRWHEKKKDTSSTESNRGDAFELSLKSSANTIGFHPSKIGDAICDDNIKEEKYEKLVTDKSIRASDLEMLARDVTVENAGLKAASEGTSPNFGGQNTGGFIQYFKDFIATLNIGKGAVDDAAEHKKAGSLPRELAKKFIICDLLYAHQICHFGGQLCPTHINKSTSSVFEGRSQPHTESPSPSTTRPLLSTLNLDAIPNDERLYTYPHPDKLYVMPSLSRTRLPLINLDSDEEENTQPASSDQASANISMSGSEGQRIPESTQDFSETNTTHLPQALESPESTLQSQSTECMPAPCTITSNVENKVSHDSVTQTDNFVETSVFLEDPTTTANREQNEELEESFECADCSYSANSLLGLHEHYFLHAFGN